jgi:hypothetical protein
VDNVNNFHNILLFPPQSVNYLFAPSAPNAGRGGGPASIGAEAPPQTLANNGKMYLDVFTAI